MAAPKKLVRVFLGCWQGLLFKIALRPYVTQNRLPTADSRARCCMTANKLLCCFYWSPGGCDPAPV